MANLNKDVEVRNYYYPDNPYGSIQAKPTTADAQTLEYQKYVARCVEIEREIETLIAQLTDSPNDVTTMYHMNALRESTYVEMGKWSDEFEASDYAQSAIGTIWWKELALGAYDLHNSVASVWKLRHQMLVLVVSPIARAAAAAQVNAAAAAAAASTVAAALISAASLVVTDPRVDQLIVAEHAALLGAKVFTPISAPAPAPVAVADARIDRLTQDQLKGQVLIQPPEVQLSAAEAIIVPHATATALVPAPTAPTSVVVADARVDRVNGLASIQPPEEIRIPRAKHHLRLRRKLTIRTALAAVAKADSRVGKLMLEPTLAPSAVVHVDQLMLALTMSDARVTQLVSANVVLSKTVEGLSKTVEGLSKTVEGLNKTVEGLNKTVEAMGRTITAALTQLTSTVKGLSKTVSTAHCVFDRQITDLGVALDSTAARAIEQEVVRAAARERAARDVATARGGAAARVSLEHETRAALEVATARAVERDAVRAALEQAALDFAKQAEERATLTLELETRLEAATAQARVEQIDVVRAALECAALECVALDVHNHSDDLSDDMIGVNTPPQTQRPPYRLVEHERSPPVSQLREHFERLQGGYVRRPLLVGVETNKSKDLSRMVRDNQYFVQA